jgi:glutamate-1-semialdehyde aminotransferase
MEGGYHGTHDYAAASTSAASPRPRATVVSAPFNDLEAVARVVANGSISRRSWSNGARAAGVLPARADFLHGLRELTRPMAACWCSTKSSRCVWRLAGRKRCTAFGRT